MFAPTHLETISAALVTFEATASDFVLTMLEDPNLKQHECTLSLVDSASETITALSQHPRPSDSLLRVDWAHHTVKKTYLESLMNLSRNGSWHFNASHACAEDLENILN